MSELWALDAWQLLEAYKARDATPAEAVESFFARIASADGRINAVGTVLTESAEAAAAESSLRWLGGNPRPLEGIPFGIKDNVDVAGTPTTGGSRLYEGYVPTASADVVTRLVDAGAIPIAKLHLPEFAFGDAHPEHAVANPWDARRWCGGSSSGAAAALAARELPLAIGTDTGGSIRVPASYCGVTGLKPTLGRVPTEGVMPVSWTLDHAGPMARTAADLALALSVMGRRPRLEKQASGSPQGIRIGIPLEPFYEGCEDAVFQATQEALAVWKLRGATVETVAVADIELAPIVCWIITVAEFASVQEVNEPLVGEFTASARDRFCAGSAVLARDYLKAMRMRARLRHQLQEVFRSVDVLVMPSTTTAAPVIAPEPDPLFDKGDRCWLEDIARNFLFCNAAGLPAVVAPSGYSSDGLPLSVQIVGPPSGDEACISLATWLQEDTDHHRRAPSGS